MTFDYQVTLYCKTRAYKPVSCIVHEKSELDLTDKETRKALIRKGTQKICNFRRWTARDLTEYQYLTAKVRKYDKENM